MNDERKAILPLVLGAAFLLQVIVLGWEPRDRETWLLENAISIPLALTLVLARRRIDLSASAWCLVFAFLALHEIGSHYTYSQVPWLEWSRDGFGWAPGVERNHYDRFVHFTFGLLLVRPLYELLERVVEARPVMLRLTAVAFMSSLSSLYELLEVAAAITMDPELGLAFVGAQGDMWDAQKDMGLALLGSLLGIVFVVGLKRGRRRLEAPAAARSASTPSLARESVRSAA